MKTGRDEHHSLCWAQRTGQKRRKNEDRWLADGPLGLFLVADGLGGEASGDYAAQMLVDTFPALLRRHLRGVTTLANDRATDRIQALATALNEQIWQEGQKHIRLRGMGATLVFSLVWEHQALIAHVGDSRAYLLRDDALEQLTKDHSTVQRLLDEGKITPEQADDHPASGELTRYIGMARETIADIRMVGLEPGDCLLLCSDGLSSMLDPVEIEGILSLRQSPEQTCRLLVGFGQPQGRRRQHHRGCDRPLVQPLPVRLVALNDDPRDESMAVCLPLRVFSKKEGGLCLTVARRQGGGSCQNDRYFPTPPRQDVGGGVEGCGGRRPKWHFPRTPSPGIFFLPTDGNRISKEAICMCGIVGYVGNREAEPILLEGLRRLEYRGYDSAGVATLTGAHLHLRKRAGRIADLASHLREQPAPGCIGISHTRWATHGPANDRNAHPHVGGDGRGRRRPQRRHRKLRRSQTPAASRRRRLPQRHRHRGHRPAHRPPSRRRPGRGRRARSLPLLKGTYGLAVVSPRIPT